MATTSHTNEEVFQRITRLEATQAEMSKQFGELAGAVRSLATEFQAARKPQWQTYIAAAAVLITLAVGGFSIVMLANRGQLSPVELRTTSNTARIEEQASRMDRMFTTMGALSSTVERVETTQRERFAENETQFLALSNQTNMRQSEHDRLLRMLWRRSYGEELPGNGIWPVVGKQ